MVLPTNVGFTAAGVLVAVMDVRIRILNVVPGFLCRRWVAMGIAWGRSGSKDALRGELAGSVNAVGCRVPRFPHPLRRMRQTGWITEMLTACVVAAAVSGSALAAPEPIQTFDVRPDLWVAQDGSEGPRSLSLLAGKLSGRFGENAIAVPGLEPDGRPGLLIGGGRAGTNQSAGLAVVGVVGPDDRFEFRQTFEGALRKPGFGRILAAALDSKGRQVLAIGLPERVNATPSLTLWRRSADGGWEAIERPGPETLAGLNDAMFVEDLTGDGEIDLVLAHQRNREVLLQVLPGVEAGFSRQPRSVARWPVPMDTAQPEIFVAGDVDADGLTDLLVGIPGKNTEEAGRVFLIRGQTWTTNGAVDAVWTGTARDSFGKDALVEDLNGDGVRDLVIGAPDAEGDRGRVYVFRGRPGGWESEPAMVVSGAAPGDRLGYAMAAGRFAGRDRDGFLVIGAPGASPPDRAGRIHCIAWGDLRTGVVSEIPGLRLEGRFAGAELGIHLLGPGDLNGDGTVDLVIGMPSAGIHGNRAGRVDILHGSPRWPSSGIWIPTFPNASPAASDANGAATMGNRNVSPALDSAPTADGNWKAPWKAGGTAVVGLLLGTGLLFGWRRLERVIRDRERLQIASDLHDELSPSLSFLAQSKRAESSEVAEAAREVATGIERTLRAIHPERQSLFELSCVLTELSQTHLGDLPLRCRFAFPESLPTHNLRPGVTAAILRATQEALNNVRKHSEATTVLVGIRREGDTWVVFIQDNGVGLERSEEKDGRMGLAGMKGRMKEIGGECELVPTPGGGATVQLRLPRI